ncbi:PDZ domain-containing protein [Roseiconus lacunae]|uniref:PDZ domain-containing protein n=1 Tax=Roseiconus lacunae TaxID=2605694 RepID=UPI001E3C9FC7|nr:PDZ domain-containing protein [Roseiconus lacunae]MCD0460552.1 PDZ domain-containing protein [Roseiconus lacunae]
MKFRTRIAAVGTTVALMMPAAQAQNVGGAISDAVQDRLSPGNTIDSRDALRNGIRRATGGVLRGDNLNQAVRDGINETARSVDNRVYTDGTVRGNAGVYTDSQGYIRNRGDVRGQSRTMYQANDGRWFYLDNNNRAVYSGSASQDGQYGSDHRTQTHAQSHAQFYGHQGNAHVGYQGHSERGRLGAAIEETDQGVRVTSVVEGSAAAKAGLRTGDVIVTADGQKIESPQALGQRIADAESDTNMQLVVKRDGREQALTASLGAKMDSQSRTGNGNRMMRGNRDLNNRVNQLEQQLNSLRTTIDDLRRDIQTTGNEAIESTRQRGETLSDNVENEAYEAANEVNAAAENATSTAREAAAEASQTTRDAVRSTEAAANEAAKSATDAARNATDAARETVESAGNGLGLEQ